MRDDERSDRPREEDGALRALEERLDRLAADQGSIAAEARELDDAPGLARVEETLRRAWAEDAAAARRPSPAVRVARWLVPLAAAAAVIVFLVERSKPDRPAVPDRPSGTVLESGGFGALALVREPGGGSALTWSGPDGARFVVTVRDARSGDVLLDGEVTFERRLALEPSPTSDWPRRLFVEVELTEDDGTRRTTSAVLERE